MRAKGYGPYRGRSPWKTLLKVLIVVVIILGVLGVAAAIYLQQFLVVSQDGVRVDLPFFQREDDQADPSPTPSPSTSPLIMVTSTPEPEPDPSLPVALPAEALYDGTAVSQMEDAGGDCVLFDMKTDSGALNYLSSLDLAATAGVCPDNAALNAAIQALNATENFYTVARVSCFKDNTVTDYVRDMAILTNSGYRWTDPENIHWISPTSVAVREYLTGICVELAQLGFDEILLDNAGYPNQGNLGYIKVGPAYDPSQLSAVIDSFYAQVETALADYHVKLSVVASPEACDGTDTLTGQTPENLSHASRIWTRDEKGILLPLNG